jgi:hypothetical protein
MPQENSHFNTTEKAKCRRNAILTEEAKKDRNGRKEKRRERLPVEISRKEVITERRSFKKSIHLK